MMVKNILFFYSMAICCMAKLAHLTDVTLDLDWDQSTESVEVVHSEHYGLASVEYFAKRGYTVTAVVQGPLPVWKGTGDEHFNNAILYFGREPLSLLYVNVLSDHKSLYKYFVKVSGQWREVVEKRLEFLVDIDRSAYTENQLDEFATEYLEHASEDDELINSTYFKFMDFHTMPIYSCELEMSNPSNRSIMEQSFIGPCFGKVFTPRMDYAITRVTFNGELLWSRDNDPMLCSSVRYFFKGYFRDMVVMRLENIDSQSYKYLCFFKTIDGFAMIPFPQFRKLFNKMLAADYSERDIMRYKDGFLKTRDFAFIFSTLFAMIVAGSVALYSM